MLITNRHNSRANAREPVQTSFKTHSKLLKFARTRIESLSSMQGLRTQMQNILKNYMTKSIVLTSPYLHSSLHSLPKNLAIGTDEVKTDRVSTGMRVPFWISHG